MKRFLSFSCSFILVLATLFLAGCKAPESTLKVFVRDKDFNLVGDVKVKIVSSSSSTPSTAKYSEKAQTNSSGYATFNLDTFFKLQIATAREGYFDIIIEKDGIEGSGSVRVTYQTTSVQTVQLVPPVN